MAASPLAPPPPGGSGPHRRGTLYGGEIPPASRRSPYPPSEAFVASLGLAPNEAQAVRLCLDTFPETCTSRGMFFEGVLDALVRGHGAKEADEARRKTELTHRVQSFSLYPHRDFYKLFYYAARRLHPTVPIEQGLSRIAELFYPNMFAENLAGKTMAVFLGKDPVSVMGRLVDAYRIAAPWNEHTFEVRGKGPHRWTCKVEPCPFYPSIFRGIATGMLRSVTGHTPQIEVVEHQPGASEQRFVLSIQV